MSKHIVTIVIDDPADLIADAEEAKMTVEDLVSNCKGHEVAENCDFEVLAGPLMPSAG